MLLFANVFKFNKFSDIFRLAERLDKVEKRNEQLARENLTLRDSLKSLQQKADHLEGKVDDMGIESRSTSLLIHGVRETAASQTEVKAQVIRILNDKIVEAKLSDADVTTVERMGPRRASGAAAQAGVQKVSPILIKLNTKDVRDRILRNRRQLKDSGVSVTEQLTPMKASLLKRASDLVRENKLQAAWSHDGKILVKDQHNKITSVFAISDLDMFN